MQVAEYDVAIIGAGPGGYVASIRAGQLGLKTVCVEKDPRLGGTCTLRGCIPTKAILHTAELYENAQDSADQGVKVGSVELDMANVVKHKESVVSKSSKGVEFLFRKNKVDRVHGHARLAGPGRIVVSGGSSGNQTIEAKHIVLASGSAPRLLPGLEIHGPHIVTSDELLESKIVPKRLIVLGAGAVGVEFASVFRRFGSEVTIVELLPRLVPLEDEDISAEFEKGFRRRGIKALTAAKLEQVDRTETGVKATVTTAKGTEARAAEVLLCAVGRRPVTATADPQKVPT